jgi:hypothetical protein
MPVELSDAISPVAATMRPLIRDVRTWALAQGKPVDAAVLALLLAAKSEWRKEPVTRWTRIGVYQHLWGDVRNWCSLRSVLLPEDVPEVLWLFLSFLSESGRLDPASDPLRELRRPLRCYGGLGADGLPAPAGAPPVRCVCKVPYRRRG